MQNQEIFSSNEIYSFYLSIQCFIRNIFHFKEEKKLYLIGLFLQYISDLKPVCKWANIKNEVDFSTSGNTYLPLASLQILVVHEFIAQ